MRFFVACAKGLEYLLADELLALGAKAATAATAGVNVEGQASLPYRAAMFSRLASRVLLPLAEFDCENEQDLYQGVHAVDWADHVAPEGTLAVDAHVSGPTLTHERYAAQRIKDAVVDRMRAHKTYTLFNGRIECTLLLCDPLQPPQREVRPPQPLGEGAQMVANRLRKNLKRLKSWREREGVTCYRLYDADLPEYAAAVDIYQEAEGDARLFLQVQEYAAPATIPEADSRRRFGELLAAIHEVFDVPREQVVVKTRQRGKGGSKYGRMDESGHFFVVTEGAVRLRVNLHDYLDTGLFLDHRPLRLRIGGEARGKRFLNLFCYTGAATVHAAAGGAAATTSVDLSTTYLDWAGANLALNGIGGPAHRLVQADAMAWLEHDRGQYDLIFCDPPTFSNSARAEDFDTQRDHVRLLNAALARLAPGGLLLFSNNFRRFRLDEAALETVAEVREISARTIAADFERNPRIHRTWELRRRG